MSNPVLEVVGVRKNYGRTAALNGVDLSIAPGELFGLLGPNGAGKTTLMSIISGLLDASSGEVRLFGERFGTTDRTRRPLLGLATQDLAIYPELTARENLQFFGKLYGLRGDDLRQRVDDMLAAVALSDRADQRAGTFSGGMKRRLNLAVAVVHRPNILLLDEPTTGVDPQSRNHIFEQVKSLNAAGLTVIYTSHYMEEVQALCPRIAIMDAGRVLACDRLPNLLSTLHTTIRLGIPGATDELATAFRELGSVIRVTLTPDRIAVATDTPAALLPRLVEVCNRFGANLATVELDAPNLERVFLNLTGHGLRD